MSRILRRPLFRGGSIDSRGTGITSGLTEEPRVKAQQGLFMGMDPRYSGFGTQPILTSEDLIRSYTPSGIPQYLQDLYQSNVSQRVDGQRFPSITEEEDETIISNYPIDRLAERSQIVPSNLVAKKDKETKTTDDADKEDILIPKAKPELKDTGISDLEKDDTEINLEDIFAERIKRAKRGDIADILLGASEGFLEEGTLTGGAKGAVRAGRGPSRTEQAKQAQENILLQKAFAESKSQAEFDQAVKLLGIKGKQAEDMARLYAELGLGKKGQATNFSRAMEILQKPDLYSPEIVAAAKRSLGGFGSLSEAYMETKKNLGSVSSSDFLNLVRQTEPGFNESNIIPSGTDVESLVSQGLDDGIYVIDGEKRVIEISDGKKVRDVKF